MASNSFLRMLFNQKPRRDVSDVLGLPPLSDEDRGAMQGERMEAPNSRIQDNSKSGAVKGAITGAGDILSSMFAQAQEPTRPLQFNQLPQQMLIPLVDPRYQRAKGGKVKKGQPYLVGEKGPEIVVPQEDGDVVPNTSEEYIPQEKLGYDSVDSSQVDEMARTLPISRNPVVDTSQVTETPTEDTVTDTMSTPQGTADVTVQSPADVLRGRIGEIQGRDYSKKRNEDGTVTYGKDFDHKRNWKDALRGAGLGLLSSLGNAQVNPNDPNPLSSMFGRAIGGAGVGGVLGATVDNVDNKMQDRMKLAQLLPQYEQAYGMERQKKSDEATDAYKTAQGIELRDRPQRAKDAIIAKATAAKTAFDRRMQMRDRDADIRSGEAKRTVDANGMVWKEFTKADSSGKIREKEAVVNPVTGEQDFDPGEQMVIDPQTGVQVKAKTIIAPQAMIATGNANRQTTADKDNAEKFWQTQKTNIDNQMKYMSDVNSLLADAIKADSGIDDGGVRAEMKGKYDEITQLSNSPLPEGLDTEGLNKAQEERVKRVNKLVDEYNKLNTDLITNISKTAAGKAKADQIHGMIKKMAPPAKLVHTPYKPTLVQGGVVTGKPVPKEKDPMGIYQ